MRTLICFFLAIVAVVCISCDDSIIYPIKECYTIGEERCYENRAQWCNFDYYWETFMDCDSIGSICYYDYPVHADGYTDIAVCD